MYYPNEKEFLKLTKKGNVIPVYKEILADLETPVSAYLKIADAEYSFLLESVEEQEKIGRFSFLASKPVLIFQSQGKTIKITDMLKNTTKVFQTYSHPLLEIKKIMSPFKFVNLEGLPRFCGGLVGYIGYDCVRFFERLPEITKDDLKLPDCLLMLTNGLLVFDNIKKTIKIVSSAHIPKRCSASQARIIYNNSLKTIEKLHRSLTVNKRVLFVKRPSKRKLRKETISSNLSKADFLSAVNKAKQYIRNGDIIQVVLSQRFSLALRGEPFNIYRRLRSINPSPYMFFFKLRSFCLLGASPEMLVRCEDTNVETRPIAGTRPRGGNSAADERLKNELLKDSKERCEHTMLVDLGRNDLGRVCRFDSIRLAEFMKVEFYSHVMHIVSSIEGKLKKACDIFDLLIASFPAGTVTGAPKVRAMEIIEELEATRRGPYAGCVGYFSYSGNLDTCITIRSILIKGKKAFVQAGAGIVADSKPLKEYQETVNKAKAMFEAIRQTKP